MSGNVEVCFDYLNLTFFKHIKLELLAGFGFGWTD